MARREGIPKPCPPPLGLCTRLLDSSPMLYWFPVTNHRPQTSGLKTTDIELLTVPEATSLKLRCQQGHTPSGGSWGRGGGLQGGLLLGLTSGVSVPWLVPSHGLCLPVSVFSSGFLIWMFVTGFRTRLPRQLGMMLTHLKTRNVITSAKTPFADKFTFASFEGRHLPTAHTHTHTQF